MAIDYVRGVFSRHTPEANRVNDKLLESIAKYPQSMIFTPKFNTFANGKSINCGFIAILANNYCMSL